jgi:hypothetical protein
MAMPWESRVRAESPMCGCATNRPDERDTGETLRHLLDALAVIATALLLVVPLAAEAQSWQPDPDAWRRSQELMLQQDQAYRAMQQQRIQQEQLLREIERQNQLLRQIEQQQRLNQLYSAPPRASEANPFTIGSDAATKLLDEAIRQELLKRQRGW